jgi:hypothetical protein
VLISYAFLTAFGIRHLDNPLQAQPNNPFLIAVFAAVVRQILMFARGDFGVVAFESFKCFVCMILMAWGARILFGTERNAQRGTTRVQIPQYRITDAHGR